MADEMAAAVDRKTVEEHMCIHLLSTERCGCGELLENYRARMRVFESAMRFYALLGNWQFNKEGHYDSACQRDLGDLARKVMGGLVLIPEDEAAKRDGEIERLKTRINELCDLHDQDMIQAAEEANRLAEHNRIGLSQLFQELAEALGMPKTIEGAEYGMYAVRKGIKELRDKLALASAEEGKDDA